MSEIEKHGDDEWYVCRTETGDLLMRAPGTDEFKPYDGRFGELPEDFKEGAFPNAN